MSKPKAEPCYFLSLELENVRCFAEKQALDLSDGQGQPAMWTVILGENGVGKTTLLQVLALLRFGPVNLINGGINRRGKDYSSAWATSVDKQGEQFQHSFTYDESSGGGSHRTMKTYGSPALLAYGGSRAMRSNSVADEPSTNEVSTLFDPSARLMNAEEWLLRLDYLSATSERRGPAQTALEQVQKMLVDLLPEVSALHILGPRIDVPGLRTAEEGGVAFTTPYGRVGLRELSLGYQTLVAWTVDLAYRLFRQHPELEDPLTAPCVVLVDEIDLHLHPAWQRTIHQRLRAWFPNTQFIVTAHSPLIVQTALDGNLAVLRREGDHVVIENDPRVVAGWRVDQILTSDLFGLDSARPPQVESLYREQAALLDKPARTDAEDDRLRAIDAELAALPTGATPADDEAARILREAAALVRSGKLR